MNDQTQPSSPEIKDIKPDSTEIHHNIHQVLMEQQSRIIHEVNSVIDDEHRLAGESD
jgi:hypothetical protein